MISVIVPVYNSEQYLPECLESILNQTCQDFEVILIDDGSSDSSLEICQNYKEKDCRIHVIHQKNSGSTSARKAGVRAAKGEYISFIDSDDWIEPCFLENLYELMRKNQADIVVSGCIKEFEDNTIIRTNKFEEGYYSKRLLREKIYPQMLIYEKKDYFNFGILQYLWSKLYKKSIIEPCINNLDERIYNGEDVACVFDACLRAKSIVIDNHLYYHYKVRSNSICTLKKNEKYFVNVVYLYHYMMQVFQNSEEQQVMIPQLKYLISVFMNYGMSDIFGSKYVRVPLPAIWTLPQFPENEKCKIAIWGAGAVGQSYYKQLLEKKDVEITNWVDSVTYGKKVWGVVIENPDSLDKEEWDYVLIAVRNQEKQEEIVMWLKAKGISENVILRGNPSREFYYQDLYEFRSEEG